MPFNPSNLKVAHRLKAKLHPPMANYADFPPLLTAPQERHYPLSTVEDLSIILEGEKCQVLFHYNHPPCQQCTRSCRRPWKSHCGSYFQWPTRSNRACARACSRA
uniref:Expressed conserved protein n=1 Tax=Echinococcus granulosus TaxID=6210 RepID=A0A068WWP2_ECHGR|nr:hypothetical protein EgrG_000736600 [Echinococcus granulosus]